MRAARLCLIVVGSLVVVACGSPDRVKGPDDAPVIRDSSPEPPCVTTISGRVFAPNGTLPLYNVIIYVPESVPGPFPEGAQCAKCSNELPGGAITRTISDTEGEFRLLGAPAGDDVPIIVTTGKWRRIVTLPHVEKCVDNPVNDGVLRLPRNRTEGSIPKIAIVTGGCDALACIFWKMGLDPTEFGSSSNDPERITFYNGVYGTAPGTPQPAETLWSDLNELSKFDMVINSCECGEHNENKTAPDVLRQYADNGGRVFGSHFHYTWPTNLIPEWQGVAQWGTNFSNATPVLVDMSHADGMKFAKWLLAVGASSILGQTTLSQTFPIAGPVNPPTKRWLYASGTPPATTHYFSFKTPIGAVEQDQCGKFVYAGLHVSAGSVGTTFPAQCNAGLTPDEKALVFLLFDLGACVDVIAHTAGSEDSLIPHAELDRSVGEP